MVNTTQTPAQVYPTGASVDKADVIRFENEMKSALEDGLRNGGKIFDSRAAAVSEGQAALPGTIGYIFTREGSELVLRGSSLEADDPLFPTAPRWGVRTRIPTQAVINQLVTGKADITDSGKTFVSRAAAVSAGQAALPAVLGQIETREGNFLVLRSPTATADDPLFNTAPQWGVVSRIPNSVLLDTKADIANSGKTFVSRAAAVSAGQAALPAALGQIETREGNWLVKRQPNATTDDPLFETAPQWGAVARYPVQAVLSDNIRDAGIIRLSGVGGTANDITANMVLSATNAGVALSATNSTVSLIPSAANTGPVTLTVAGETRPVHDEYGQPLPAGYLVASREYYLRGRSVGGVPTWRVISGSVAARDVQTIAADVANARPRDGTINETAAPPVMLRVFSSSAATPSEYMRIWMPAGTRWAEMLLKRGSISTNPQDVGLSQVTWEPDEVLARSDAAIFKIASTNLVGTWTTDNAVLPGVYTRRSSDEGAARSFSFQGDYFRFGYVEDVGSSAFQLEVDGRVVATIAPGTALARRVITRGGFGAGGHTLVVRRLAGATGSLWIIGSGMSDFGGMSYDIGDFSSAVADPAGSYVQAGVQTLVMMLQGGLRMGGGHGGSWLRAPARLTVDGRPVALEDTAGGYYAGREIILTESFELRQSAGAAPVALVTRRMVFIPGGYDCDMDIRLPNPTILRDLLWGMLKAGTAMTRVSLPVAASLTASAIETIGQIVAFDGNGLRVDIAGDGQVRSDGPAPYTSVRDSGKLYNIAALATPFTFTGPQRLSYSTRFSDA